MSKTTKQENNIIERWNKAKQYDPDATLEDEKREKPVNCRLQTFYGNKDNVQSQRSRRQE
jgi:hypothetical protein